MKLLLLLVVVVCVCVSVCVCVCVCVILLNCILLYCICRSWMAINLLKMHVLSTRIALSNNYN